MSFEKKKLHFMGENDKTAKIVIETKNMIVKQYLNKKIRLTPSILKYLLLRLQ